MRICFFSGDITRSGGTEKVTCQIASKLSNQFDVSIISITEENEVFYDLDQNVKRFALFNDKLNLKKQYLPLIFKLRRFLKEYHIDILINVDTILDMFAIPATRFLSTKVVSWEHFNFYETLGKEYRMFIRKHLTRRADCIVTLTKEDKQYYLENVKNIKRIEQIYNPIEVSKNEMQYNVESKIILSVGRIVKLKGFDYILNIAEKINEKYPEWIWHIIGDGEELERLENDRRNRSINNVIFLGRKDNVNEYLTKAAMYVLTSKNEGCPLVILEAKSCNLPVVSFVCRTGPAEMIKDNINGYLVRCFDIDEMENKIVSLIEDSEKRKSFSENAMWGTEEFANDFVISKWVGILESLNNL
ncbi:MAG: glycosyltransferase family 4 protein [Bacillota bacterium]